MTLVAVPHRPMVVMAVASPPRVHGVAARRAQLPSLCQHASFDLVFVGNEVVAEAQSVGHAKLSGIALSISPVQTGKKYGHRQDDGQGEAQDETQMTHG
jgi:hypothetical protein